MRYSEEHKAATHRRIVDEAARRFRRDGIGATGLQPLMKSLGMTHGGFYAHFASKDALVESALRQAAGELTGRTAHWMADGTPLTDLITNYLSAGHRDHPESGCPLPTISTELGQRGTPSPVTDDLLCGLLRLVEERLSTPDAADRSVMTVGALVGALQLSRATADPELSDRILEATRRMLCGLVDPEADVSGAGAPGAGDDVR